MLDYCCGVSTPIQYTCGEIIKAKLGKKSDEDVRINQEWEAGIVKVYSDMIALAKTLFVPESGFTFVNLPAGMSIYNVLIRLRSIFLVCFSTKTDWQENTR